MRRSFLINKNTCAELFACLLLSGALWLPGCAFIPADEESQEPASIKAPALKPDEVPEKKLQPVEVGLDSQLLTSELQSVQARVEGRGIVLTLDDLHFDTGSAQINSSDVATLLKVVNFLKKYPELEVIIEGHTDSIGSAEANRVLSRARALSVYEQLVQLGIEKQRLSIIALGEDYPLAPNDTPEGRQQNRRVEVVISAQQPVKVK